MPPKVIGPYRVLETLGSGGVGTVYRAIDRRSGEMAALKLLSTGPALDPRAARRLAREFETLEADSLILALGQDVDLGLLDGVPGLAIKDGVVQVGANMMTGHPGVFAGGDMVPSERTVTVGVGHGKKAARHIDGWLRGAPYADPVLILDRKIGLAVERDMRALLSA